MSQTNKDNSGNWQNSPLTPKEYRKRQDLLTKVKNFWVKGVLEKSFHNQALIELGLEESPDTVAYLGNIILETEDFLPRPLTEAIKVIDIFKGNNTEESLLILGEPGLGKTTTLLQLAQDLISRAEQDINLPIPVVFNLSAWNNKPQKIEDWLIEELATKYDVPQAISKTWLKKQQILPLLDGLDEVEVDYRDNCIATLNQFKQDYVTGLVVCSRSKEYENLSNRLNFQTTVSLQPLTLEKICGYLDSLAAELTGLRKLIAENLLWQKLAQSPATLNIMALAYQGVKFEDLPQFEAREDYLDKLLDDYVERRLKHIHPAKITPKYSESQTKIWLSWLAKKMMVQESKTVFLIEMMQPRWLKTRWQKLLYKAGVKIAIALVLFGTAKLSGLLIPTFESFVSMTMNFVAILCIIVLKKKGNLISDLKGGLLIQAIFYAIGSMPIMLILICINAFFILTENLSNAEIQPLATFKIEPQQINKELTLALMGGIVVGLIVCLGMITSFRPIVIGVSAGLSLISGLAGTLLFLLVFGLIGRLVASHNKMSITPNQSIKQSATNAIVATLFLGLVSSLAMGLIFGPFWEVIMPQELPNLMAPTPKLELFLSRLSVFSAFMLAIFLSFGSIGGLLYGGITCIQHLILRLVLYCNNYIPWNYARFLDYAADRLFLQKVGGGYIFTHRMLMEHFTQIK